MNTEQEIHIGDTNTKLEIEVVEWNVTTKTWDIVDVSGAIVITITVQRPDGTSFSRSGTLSTDGTDGLVYILTEVGDIVIEDTHFIQGYVELPSWKGYSSIGTFEVYPNLG